MTLHRKTSFPGVEKIKKNLLYLITDSHERIAVRDKNGVKKRGRGKYVEEKCTGTAV